jgi:hypothetical protein
MGGRVRIRGKHCDQEEHEAHRSGESRPRHQQADGARKFADSRESHEVDRREDPITADPTARVQRGRDHRRHRARHLRHEVRDPHEREHDGERDAERPLQGAPMLHDPMLLHEPDPSGGPVTLSRHRTDVPPH